MMEKILLTLLLIGNTAFAANWKQETKNVEASYKIPKGLLVAVIKVESNFVPHAVNDVNNPGTVIPSYGLGQLTKESLLTCGIPFEERNNGHKSLRCAARLLKGLYKKYNKNIEAAISGYNDGTPCFCKDYQWVTPIGRGCPLRKRQECTPEIEGKWRNQGYVNLVLKEYQ